MSFIEYPVAPAAPTKVDSMSSLESIFVQWNHIQSGDELNVIGYEVWMDTAQDGFFKKVFDGLNQPGVTSYLATQLKTGDAYNFKVRALNFNGAGEFSATTTLYSCLPPADISPVRFVSATETELTFTWSEARLLNGCPLIKTVLHIDDGQSEPITQDVEPHTNTYSIQNFGILKEYTLHVEAFTAGGSILSGSNLLTMANVPSQPAPVENDATVTNDSQIKVTLLIPDNGGSPITNLQLFKDNGMGGDLQ